MPKTELHCDDEGNNWVNPLYSTTSTSTDDQYTVVENYQTDIDNNQTNHTHDDHTTQPQTTLPASIKKLAERAKDLFLGLTLPIINPMLSYLWGRPLSSLSIFISILISIFLLSLCFRYKAEITTAIDHYSHHYENENQVLTGEKTNINIKAATDQFSRERLEDVIEGFHLLCKNFPGYQKENILSQKAELVPQMIAQGTKRGMKISDRREMNMHSTYSSCKTKFGDEIVVTGIQLRDNSHEGSVKVVMKGEEGEGFQSQNLEFKLKEVFGCTKAEVWKVLRTKMEEMKKISFDDFTRARWDMLGLNEKTERSMNDMIEIE